MKKVLIICGQTATGKTELAFYLAKKLNGEIISADSRQVYRGMDIGTGKDIPQNSQIPIWGVDLVNPNEEFSVSYFREYALKKINEIHDKNTLPIIVGGTGFYIDAIFSNQDLIDIPKNNKLRKELSEKSVSELFYILKNIDAKLADNLNNSDKNNRARLIRKIEILSSGFDSKRIENKAFNTLWIGLKLEKAKLAERIENRVQKRIEQSFEKELVSLEKKYGKLDVFGKTPGYKDWPTIDNWIKSETQYAKRQLTWFKRNKKVHWFEADDPALKSSVEKLLINWYPNIRNAQKD